MAAEKVALKRKMSDRFRRSSRKHKSGHSDQLQSMPDVIQQTGPESKGAKEESVKCVVIGDGAIGKTSLIVSYTTNDYPQEYKPTVHDFYTVQLTVEERPITFQLFDTAGQEQFNVIRRLSYHDTQIFLLCFNLVDPVSFQNIKERWIPELKEYSAKGIPFILVGLQSDERNVAPMKWSNQKKNRLKPIKTEEGEALAKKIGARRYMECSACTQKNVKNVFDTAIATALEHQERKTQQRLNERRSTGSSIRASLRRLSRRKDLSRSISNASSCSSSGNTTATSGYKTTSTGSTSTSGTSSFNISFTESLRDIFCFG